MSYYAEPPRRGGFFANLPTGVKNILVVNAIMLLATYVLGQSRIVPSLALFSFGSPFFKPWQLVTYMFLHGGFGHFFFNMFTLLMFAPNLENIWGTKKFLLFYFVTGIGAGLFHNLVIFLRILANPAVAASLAVIPTVGASGAIYGVLLGFAMLFPDAQMRFLFFPFVPVKAKWMVVGFAILELLTGVSGGDGIAHFAHLGGMLFSWLLIRYWKKNNRMYY